MKKIFFQGLQFRILLIVIVATIPFIAFSIYDAEQDRKQGIEDLKDEAIQLVNFTLAEESQTIDGTRQLLISLSNLSNEYLTDSVRCNNYLSNLLKKFSRYMDLGIVKKNGFLFASGRPTEYKRDFTNNEFFKEVIEDNGFSIGEYFVDSVSNKRIINLGYPILDKKQEIKAVLFASLDVKYIDVIEENLTNIFHEKSLFIKIDNEGDILATNSLSNDLINRIVNSSFLKNILEQENGIIEVPDSNNQKYLFVFASTKSHLFQEKLHLIVGVKREDFFSEINKTLYRNLFLIGVLFVIVLVSVLILSDKYILKIVKKLIKATKEMSTGNLSVRSKVSYGTGELGQLAMTFDRMAESLEEQNTERKKVEDSLRESEERFRNLFEHSPVSLWWEDFSEIKKHIDHLRAAGIEDFKTYFQRHPEELANCVTMLKVVEVNNATLQLYQAENKDDLLKGLVRILKKESYAVFTEELIALTAGKSVFECEANTQTLTGKRKYVIFKLLILPGYEETWSKLLVSITDITERKRAELALQENEIKFRVIFENSVDAIGVSKLGVHVFVNSAYLTLFGYTDNEELTDKPIVDLIAPSARGKILDYIQLRSKGEFVPSAYETRGLRKDGSEFDMDVRVSNYELNGENYTLVILRDITERKQAEAQIRFQASLLEQVSNGVAVVDMEGKLIYWNRYAEILHGWKKEEVLGKPVLEFLVSEKQKQFAGELINSIFHKEHAEVEIPLLKKNGEEFPAHVSYSVLRNALGEPHGILGISIDISERKRAEGTIRLQSEIVKNISEAVYLVNAKDLTIIYANRKMESMFGYEPDEMNGMHVSIINAPSESDPVQVAKEIEKALVDIGAWRGEVRNLKKDGTPFWGQATISKFDHPELGTIYISLQLDITERKKAEEERSKLLTEIQEADNQLRLLSRRLLETQEAERKNISRELHDEIGQTLTAVKINLQSIQRISKSSRITEDLAITISYVEQSLQQVRDISLNLRPSILDDLGMEAALRWLIDRFAKSSKIKFDFQFNAFEPKFPKDLQLNCYRIAQEALNNIVKYSDAKRVMISISLEEKSLDLKIADDGKGFNVQKVREQALKGKSLGILSMEERVKLAGGEFNILSSEKNGTEVHAIFHLK